jgi:2-dehydropantoate 2-reductase
MKDARMRRAVPYIPNILDAQRRKEYVPMVAADKIRTLPEEAAIPPKLEGNEGRAQSIIEVLIIAKKAGETIRAIQAVRHRLKRNSTIVLLHNGMGVLSEIQECWNDRDRPNILEGFSTHGISKQEEFTIDHWGRGMIHMAIAPRKDESDIFKYQSIKNVTLPSVINSRHVQSDLRLELLSRNEKYQSLVFIIQQLLSNRVLNGTLRAYSPNLYLIQLRRTILQSIIQSLGTLQRCTNGEVIRNKFNHSLIGKLLSEISPALQQDPVISSSPKFLNHFSFHELYAQVRHMALATSSHINSIQQDIVGKRETELGYHSGYLLRFARQKGVKMPTWRILYDLIKAEALLEQTRHNEFIPMSKDGEVLDLPEWTYGVAERYWKIERVVERGEVIRPKMFDEPEQDPLEADDEVVEETAILEDQSTTEEATQSSHETAPLTKRLRWTSSGDRSYTRRQRTLVPVPHLGFDSKNDSQVKRALAAAMAKQSESNGHDERESDREVAHKSLSNETI